MFDLDVQRAINNLHFGGLSGLVYHIASKKWFCCKATTCYGYLVEFA